MGLGRVVASSGSLPTAAVLSGVYLYSRLQARGGHVLAEPSQSSVRSSLASSGLAHRLMGFRMRGGGLVRCRIVDAGGLLSVNVDREYDIPGFDWASTHTIVDIGAHVGTFTVWAAMRAPGARVLAVEPNPETFPLLERNIRDNGLHGRVTAIHAAVGAAPGTGTLELVEHSLGTRLARTDDGAIKVRIETVPALLAQAAMDDVDLLKIDCEGMEYEALAAMGPGQLSQVKVVACEYHPEPDHDVTELDSILAAAGFRVQRPDGPFGILWATR